MTARRLDMAVGNLKKYGITKARLRSMRLDRYNVINATFGLKAPLTDADHPVDVSMTTIPVAPKWIVPCVGMEMEFKNGQGEYVYYYEGLSAGVNVGETYFELEGNDGHEPIETHPYFDQIGSKYQAQYDSTGRFVGFAKMLDGKLNPMYGATEYLSMGMVWRQTTIERDLPNGLTDRVECVDTPPSYITSTGSVIAPPTLRGRRNWLKLAPQARFRGNVWQIVQTWLASGRNGWVQEVYQQI